MAWVICPHFSKALAEHCNEHDENYAFEFIGTYYPKGQGEIVELLFTKTLTKTHSKIVRF